MYVPHPDINTHLKSNYLSVPTLINTCMVSQSNYNDCLNEQLWVNAFEHDNLPLYAPYPTSIPKWISRYHATMKAWKILNMHIAFVSYFTNKNRIIEVDTLVTNYLHKYRTIYNNTTATVSNKSHPAE